MIALERGIGGLDDELLLRVVERLLDHEPRTIAVLVTGSYAKGTADAASDLDLTAITPEPSVGYRTWFADRQPPLHVSAGALTPEEWLAAGDRPARWALGFPAINEAVYLWATDEARAVLGESPSLRHPPVEPELEDFVEYAFKARKRANAGDELGLRWFAQKAASLAPVLLRPLNAERWVRDSRDALDAALALDVSPPHYRGDMVICLGLAKASAEQVRTAVVRLGKEMLAFLREHAPDVDRQPELRELLLAGTLERHLDSLE
ncbi:MAG: nucleotidyltransferase domain-containing protein [Gaiellaceae bacterium]